jgi:subtilisin family serine protease
MKKYSFISFIMILCVSLYAQSEYYYYYKGEKQYLTLDETKINITVSKSFQIESLNKFSLKEFNIEKDLAIPDVMFGYVNFSSVSNQTEYNQIINSLTRNKDVIAIHPNFFTSEKIEIGMSSYFYVRLKDISDYNILSEIAKQKNAIIVEQNRFMPLWYTLRCTKETPDNTLNIANYFYETGLFVSSVPDFLSDDLICTNDPNFSDLWGLNNTSYPNIDVNACSAWDISQGTGIIVAVLDQGIELTHIDLISNISPLSYDSESNTSPSQIFGGHGTHCAGIIGAVKDNYIQIVGVSPESTLMSISNSLLSTPNSRIKRADGINWAWQNGADIISNSWGSSVQYDIIDEAIDSALIYGRSGKGTIIVFASGNSYSSVSYPANSNSNIIAVGAIDINGTRASFSNYGTELDVVAPGVDILSTVLNNSIAYMSGTSMACPHVAGTAALVLSVNPSLTVQQVNYIIESTAKKMGGYNYQTTSGRPNGTWHQEMGYGLVDAYAAVQAANCPTTVVSGTITTDTTYSDCKIEAVNTTIQNNANVIFDAEEYTTIHGNFEVKIGSALEVK